ncbi:helix-turn-helix domain-containing protein [Phycisphaerales bacterium AB-hyl4]|uniref:Helix-turn-helix domain-containing protein n=1 Tax=Natronomicrosphaera hydrolytica TaxID=3242702 RepID=A0ABV4U2V8_9BACT
MERQSLQTAKEVARDLGIPAKWLRDEARDGRIPHIKIGRRIRFNGVAVERALLQRAAEQEVAR